MNMTDLNIRYGPSSSIFIDGQINPKLIIEAGCWYLCTDTAELFLGIDTGADLTLKRINDPALVIPVDELVLKSDLTGLKQEIIQIVKPDVEEVKTKVEQEILPKVETVDTLKNWVENKEYLQDIDLEGYATENYVNNAIANIGLPEVDLSDYALKADVKIKANEIPFTSDNYVTNAIGNFIVGDSVKGLTIAELFAKLLGLSNVNPDSKTLEEIIEDIRVNALEMYAINDEGVLAKIPFNYLKLDQTSAKEVPTESGFYQIFDNTGNLLESGYQEIQAYNDNVYYVIALPKDINYDTMITLQGYNTLGDGGWESDSIEKFEMTSDLTIINALCSEAGIDISHIDTTKYTIWATEATPTGSLLRYVITNQEDVQ